MATTIAKDGTRAITTNTHRGERKIRIEIEVETVISRVFPTEAPDLCC
jgi:hypothetical protein